MKTKAMLKKTISSSTAALAIALTLGTGAIVPATAQAWDVASAAAAIFEVGSQYVYLNNQINYINGKGRGAYFNQMQEKVGVVTPAENPRANAMLDRVMHRLSASIAKTDPSIEKEPYNYFVNKQDTFNAFCSLGHNLSVNQGLFNVLNYNEDEIAVVVGHEMGHGQKHHPAEGVKRSLPLTLITALYASQNPNAASVLGAQILDRVGTAKAVTKPMEKQADELAFTYTVDAGYNVGAGAAVWQRVIEKMGESKENFVSEIFNPSDHPGNISRRDNYSKKITKYSNNRVKVNAETGAISLNGKTFYIPQPTESMSSKEQAYLIAGNLAAVYHNPKEKAGDVWVNSQKDLMVGQQPIMSLHGVVNAQGVTRNLKALK